MKKVCIVTATRAEYGLLRWIIEGLKNCEELSTQLIVTGTHLSPEYGNTYKYIESDGFYIDRKIEYLISSNSTSSIGKSMGVCAISFADAFADLQPDLLVVLGDRYELLPICNCALVAGIPIAHISGGDITEGAIDNQIRNAITMMSSLHFPGTETSKENIIRMINSSEHVYVTGETNLDNFMHYSFMSRTELSNVFKLDSSKKWVLVTLHPETKISVSGNMNMAYSMMTCLMEEDAEIIITQANSDYGGNEMNEYYQYLASTNPNIHYVPTLGQHRYLSYMKEVDCVIGNSSSGIVEAPFLGVPVVNIGDRQKGRHISPNVICCDNSVNSIRNALIKSFEKKRYTPDYYYGKGGASEYIVSKIKDYLSCK